MQGKEREWFNEIQQELSQLSTKFSNNLLDATKAFKTLLKDPAEVCLLPPESCATLKGRAASGLLLCNRNLQAAHFNV